MNEIRPIASESLQLSRIAERRQPAQNRSGQDSARARNQPREHEASSDAPDVARAPDTESPGAIDVLA